MNRHKHPELYMKRFYHKTYFEGWYYKQVDKTTNHTISFIPSVSFTKESSIAYLQVIYQNGNNLISDMCKYDISEFVVSSESFSVIVHKNYFSDKKLNVDFTGDNLRIKGLLNFSNLTRLDYSLLNPNIMGPFSYIPFLQCNHAVISMKHSLCGAVTINGEEVVFDGGTGYIEKDWGRSFPKKYVWIQCGNFTKESTSLFFSVATVPVLSINLEGFICNLLLNGRQYRFAKYTGAKLNMVVRDDSVKILLQDRKYILKIEAYPKDSKELFAPVNGEMTHKIKESLKGDILIELIDNRNNGIIYRDRSFHASIEMVK